MQMRDHLHGLAGPLPGKQPPVRGYLGVGAGLKAAEESKVSCLCGDSNSE